MAYIVANPDGTFSSFVGDTDITDMTKGEMDAAGIGVSDQIQDSENQEDDWSDFEESEDSFSPSAEIPSAGADDLFYYDDGSGIEPFASAPSSSSFTPPVWAVNLASHRPLGQHYLMYAVRTNNYTEYFLVLGKDVEYIGGSYRYSDCDVYSYYSYSSTLNYNKDNSQSGTISGNSYLVYSDLYFDYVGTDPLLNTAPYINYLLLLIIIILLVIGGRRRV